MYYQQYKSPIGLLYLIADDNNVQGIIFAKSWANFKKRFESIQKKSNPIIQNVKKQLAQYFSGKRKTFDLPLDLKGTEFQKRSWNALSRIQYGQTKSYKEQAALIKSPKAVRAVGSANGINPVCIVLPCHRVIASNGSLSGYAGGLKAKKFLLDLERIKSK